MHIGVTYALLIMIIIVLLWPRQRFTSGYVPGSLAGTCSCPTGFTYEAQGERCVQDFSPQCPPGSIYEKDPVKGHRCVKVIGAEPAKCSCPAGFKYDAAQEAGHRCIPIPSKPAPAAPTAPAAPAAPAVPYQSGSVTAQPRIGTSSGSGTGYIGGPVQSIS
jgi:hypothetical protein